MRWLVCTTLARSCLSSLAKTTLTWLALRFAVHSAMSRLRVQHNIAIVLLQAGKGEASLAFFQSITQDAGFGMAVKYELMARAAYSSSDLRGAVKYQRLALDDYSSKVNSCPPPSMCLN